MWSPNYCYLIDKIESVQRFFSLLGKLADQAVYAQDAQDGGRATRFMRLLVFYC